MPVTAIKYTVGFGAAKKEALIPKIRMLHKIKSKHPVIKIPSFNRLAVHSRYVGFETKTAIPTSAPVSVKFVLKMTKISNPQKV